LESNGTSSAHFAPLAAVAATAAAAAAPLAQPDTGKDEEKDAEGDGDRAESPSVAGTSTSGRTSLGTVDTADDAPLPGQDGLKKAGAEAGAAAATTTTSTSVTAE
jgi:hypothetical protein